MKINVKRTVLNLFNIYLNHMITLNLNTTNKKDLAIFLITFLYDRTKKQI